MMKRNKRGMVLVVVMLLKLKVLPRECYEAMKDPVNGPQDISRDVSSDNTPKVPVEKHFTNLVFD